MVSLMMPPSRHMQGIGCDLLNVFSNDALAGIARIFYAGVQVGIAIPEGFSNTGISVLSYANTGIPVFRYNVIILGQARQGDQYCTTALKEYP